ncbi:MAG: hypothetical protein R3F07_05810 [Opitutaceae bacterium]
MILPILHAQTNGITSLVRLKSGETVLVFFRLGETSDVLIEALGPALFDNFGGIDVLSDPVVELHQGSPDTPVPVSSSATLLSASDDWETGLTGAQKTALLDAHEAAMTFYALAEGSKDAALYVNLPAGDYFVEVTGKDAAEGQVRLSVLATGPLGYAAVQASSKSVNEAYYSAFVTLAEGSGEADRYLFRALGPALGAGGDADPSLEVSQYLTGIGTIKYIQNNDWETNFLAMDLSDAAMNLGLISVAAGSGDAAGILTNPQAGEYGIWGYGTGTIRLEYGDLSMPVMVEPTGPAISDQPDSLEAEFGDTVSFSVTATGEGDLSYKWFLDDVTIEGATDATYAVEAVELDDVGTYRVEVTDTNGTSVSNDATLTASAAVAEGIYFASIGGESGAIGVVVDGDRKATIGLHLGDTGEGLLETGIEIGDDGTFSLSAPELFGDVLFPASNRTPAAIGSLTGRISSAGLVGKVGGIPFSGTRSDPEGPFASMAGVIQISTLNGQPIPIIIMLSADGHAFILSDDGTDMDAAIGVVDGDGRLVNRTAQGIDIDLQFSQANGTVLGSFTEPGGGGGELGGYIAGSTAPRPHLSNISMRGNVGLPPDVMIAGFKTEGTGSKSILIRALGPQLKDFGLNEDVHLVDPQLLIRTLQGVEVESNDDWGANAAATELIAVSNRVGAYTLSDGSKDSAVLVDLVDGLYTARISGVGNATGISLVEVYDADDLNPGSPTINLINISMRGVVGTGANKMIAGFVVGPDPNGDPSLPVQVLIRGVGPQLGLLVPSLAPVFWQIPFSPSTTRTTRSSIPATTGIRIRDRTVPPSRKSLHRLVRSI